MDVLGLFVSRVLWLIRVWRYSGCMVAWCFQQAEYLSSLQKLRDSAPCVSPHYLTFAFAQFWGFVWGRVPLLPSVLAGEGVSTVAVLLRSFRFTCDVTEVPWLCRRCSFPGGLQFLDTLTTCPLLVTTGVWSFTVLYYRVSAVAVLGGL